MANSVVLTNFIKLGLIVLLFITNYYLINIGNTFLSADRHLKTNKKYIFQAIVFIILGLFILYLFRKYPILVDTVYTLFFSVILAYLLNPLVKYLQELGFSKSQGILIVYFIIILIVTILLLTIIPSAVDEIKSFAKNTQVYVNRLNDSINGLLEQSKELIGDNALVTEELDKIITDNLSRIQSGVINGVNKFITGVAGAFSTIIAFVLTPIMTFYFIKDQKDIEERIKNLIPKRYKKDVYTLGTEINNVLSDFVRGRLIMALYAGIVSTVILLILRVEYAIVIGFIVGVADIIPYIGPFLGFAPAVFFASMDSTFKGVMIALIFVLVQWTENNILGPKVLGDNVGLHPLVVLLSIVLGGGMFGVLGMILSVPIVAVAFVIFKFIRDKNRNNHMNNI